MSCLKEFEREEWKTWSFPVFLKSELNQVFDQKTTAGSVIVKPLFPFSSVFGGLNIYLKEKALTLLYI